MKTNILNNMINNVRVWAIMIVCLTMFGVGNAWGTDVTFTFNSDAGISALGISKPSSNSGTSLDTSSPYVLSGVSMAVTHGSTDTRVWNSAGTLDLRVYSSTGSLTFTAPGNITDVLISGNTVNGFSANVGTYNTSTGAWSGEAASVTFTAGATQKVNTIKVTYTAADPYTVNFNAQGGTCGTASLTEASGGAGVTLPAASPTAACASEGWAFYGWATAQCASSTPTAPTIVGKAGDTYHPLADNTTLHAVYATGEYTKETSAITSGAKYLIVANSTKNYVMTDSYSLNGSEGQMASVQIDETSSNKYHAAAVNANWCYTIEGTAGHYYIRDVKNSSDANYIDIAYQDWYGKGVDPDDQFTITVSSSNWTLQGNWNHSKGWAYEDLAFDGSDKVFIRGSGTVLLYKETTTPAYWSNPSCCDKEVAMSYNSAGSTHVSAMTFSAASIATCGGASTRQVTVSVTPTSGYLFKAGDELTWTKSSGTIPAAPTLVSGPTLNAGKYEFVYEFAQNDNGAGTFAAAASTYTNYHTRCLTVTYAAGEGSGDAPSSHEKVNPNSSITLADNTFTAPTGKAFDGWHDGTSKYAAGASYTVTASKTMTAQWAFVDYNVTYSAPSNGNYTIKVADGEASSATKTAHYGQTITLNATPNTGYSFTSWTVTKAGGGTVTVTNNQFTMPAENVTVTATFNIIDYNVTYTASSNGNYTIKVGSGTASSASKTANYGQTITLAATPNTGYSFSSWTVTKAGGGTVTVTSNQFTMPADNVTVTAAFSANNYTITLNNQSATTAGTANVTATYDASTNLTSAITKPEKTNYVFAGYFTETDGGGTQIIDKDGNFIAGVTGYTDGSKKWKYAGDITLYAKWAVASVTVSSTTTYYTTLAGAMTEAMKTDNSTIKILGNISGQAALTYNVAKKCTLDLNNHTVAGTVDKLLTINDASANFTITDSSVGKSGVLKTEVSANARVYCVYLTAGTLNMENGKVYCKNTKAYNKSSANKVAASAVYVTAGQTFTMNNGTVESEAQYNSYGLHIAQGTSMVTINDGLIKGHTNNTTTAAGIYNLAKGLTINNGHIIGHAYTSTSYGLYLNGGHATVNGGTIEATNDTTNNKGTTTAYGIYVAYNSSSYKGVLTIPSSSTVNVLAKARTTTASAVTIGGGSTGNTIAGGTFTAWTKTSASAYGVYSSGNVTVSGGTFNVNSKTTTAYGIYATRGTTTVNGTPTFNVKAGSTTAYGAYAYGTIGKKGTGKYSGTIEVNSGTFNVTSTTTTAYGAYAGLASRNLTSCSATNDTVPGIHYMPGIIDIKGGTFNVTATTTGAYGIVVAAAKSESGTVGTTTRIPLGTITGGKFYVQSSGDANATAYAMNSSTTAARLVVEGGYYSTDKTNAASNPTIGGKYTAPTKSCNYRVFAVSPASEGKYNYKVAQFYTITYNKGSNGTGTVDPGYKAIGDDITITSSTFTRTGYTQTAWNTNSAGTGGTNYAFGATYSTDADLTLYPTWTANTYTVTFDREGGSGGSSSVTATYDAAMPSITAPTKTGYTFGGYWDGDGGTGTKYYNANGTSARTWNKASNTTLYAKWTANTITITWNPNGAGATVSPTSSSYTYNGATVSLPTPTRSRHAFDGWYTDASGGTQITEVGTTNKPTADVTYYAHWRELTFEVKDQAGTGTADIHLTSTNNVAVYATSACGNLITIKADNLDAISNLGGGTANKQQIQIKYLDANNGDAEVAKASSPFRLCYNGSPNYNVADGSNINLNGLTEYSQTYSISYTPSGYGKIDHYKLQLRLQNNTSEAMTITLDLYGRALPEEFVIAVKKGDQWYALPNTILDNTTAITPVAITVDNTTTPTRAEYAPGTTVYKGDGRYASGTNVYGIRFTDGVLKDAKYNHLQVSSSAGTNYVWLSYTGSTTCQDWKLSSSDFSSYTLTIPSSGAGDKKFGINSYGNIGYFASASANLCADVHLLPIANKYTEIPVTIHEWGEHGVIVTPETPSDLSTAASATIHIDGASPTAATTTAVNAAMGTAKNVKVDGGALTIGAIANDGKQLYIHWKNSGGTEIGVSQVTIPCVVATDATMSSIAGTKKAWAAKSEVHILPGVTLEANASSFSGDGALSVSQMEVYPGATLKVSTGTFNATTLRLRCGWTRAGDKEYDVARVYIADDAALQKTTASMDYDIYEKSDGKHYYPLAVPFRTLVSTINYADAALASAATYGKHFGIDKYDGANRAENGATDENWVQMTTSEYLEPGKGYTITAVSSKGSAIIRVPLEFDNTWTADGEKATIDESYYKNQVSVTAYSGAASTGGGANNRNAGWNMLGVPYMSCFDASDASSDPSDAFIKGKLNFITGAYTETSDVYVNVPVHDFSEYIQKPVGEAKLLPGWCFFVQFGKDGTLSFATAGQEQTSSLPIYAPKREDMPVVKTGIVLSRGEKSDQTTLLISDKYSAAEYEINADLEKMFGNGYTLATYSLARDTRLAYNAMSTTDAKGVIPIGFRAPEDGEYTFSLNPRYAEAAVERVDLIDYKTGEVTNLMMTGYHFTTVRTQDDSRFALNVVPMAKVPTGVDGVNADSEHARKIILDDKMFIIRDGLMYDATGKRVTGINK